MLLWVIKLVTPSLMARNSSNGMAKIYVASSWRNQYFPEVVKKLRESGHKIYDFHNPPHEDSPFMFRRTCSKINKVYAQEFNSQRKLTESERHFQEHIDAMNWADICFLILPCELNAHIEAGWMKGVGKKVVSYIPVVYETELMHQLFDLITDDFEKILQYLNPSSRRRVIDVHKMTESDKKMISRAEVTITDYGLSVRCYMRTGGQMDIPLDPESDAKNGYSVDIDKAEWVTREEDGVSYDYIRVNY